MHTTDYLHEMGIDVWRLRTKQPKNTVTWQSLEQQATVCNACDLHQHRKQVIFGAGNRHADVLIIGETPNAEEDNQGEPFAGSAGELLTKMLSAIDLAPDDVYLTNLVKCRPPDDSNAKTNEIKHCADFLTQQITLLQPSVILVMGHFAAQSLLQKNATMNNIRGQVYSFGEQKIPLIVTFHPTYLLQEPKQKRNAWHDLLLLQQQLQQRHK